MLWGLCRYEDQGRVRPVLHRASTVEIIVPYGDPRAPFHKKCAFDVVDYGEPCCPQDTAPTPPCHSLQCPCA